MTRRPRPLVLLILDGWGIAPDGPGNAVCQAGTQHLDALKAAWPHTALACSGRDVGLPRGFIGNSEVGHMNIGAGRVVFQDMTRIDVSIEDGSFYENPAFLDCIAKVKASGGRLHLMGLLSDGGVHSHQEHLNALLRLAREQGLPQAYVHCFMDGRDTAPQGGLGYMKKLCGHMAETGFGRVATVIGRYWAMDRDRRWERNQRAFEAMVLGRGERTDDPLAAVQAGYDAGKTDEFIEPTVITEEGRPVALIEDGDGVIFFNFRSDRARQISRSLFEGNFAEFPRERRPKLASFVSMTRYEATFPLAVAFPPSSVAKTLGEVVSEAGLKQLRIAETEKYAHVTFFLNCGREEPFAGEERILVPSPREVATYDQKPQMSADEVTEKLLAALADYDMVVCNLANLDMVGHTGVMDAVKQACRTVDACVGSIVNAVLGLGGAVLLTADHGNSEEMLDADGGVQTAHSTNPVPFVLIGEGLADARLRAEGRLADIAPTALALLRIPQPAEMTGRSLMA
ncbi:2,3-bisphosphoglycerate-independent phosphoglycerate mutase [Desulfovibrio sp. X2]|uniref:2,3-bisphosphoglycerate-independent phosphoglycerate mutase n=1 Tax=Desulfovibrio sp. X2 TaxID=941449 RepID=UPI000358D480|nr:2,3-bisphosphoglycerate-independent phosphoglycerate mutase [Desulfovibrio sp. X2]EPR44085.1 2,3-bisphosphoglycerate-independent phosphoglycerate mutase [Desulfovibrio sp. X2]